MDDDKATRFISSLVKSIQALCNGFVDFSTSIEVIGHIHLNIDRSVKLNYVLTEEVSKSVSEGSTVFSSHSYHSQAPPSVASKSANDSSNTSQKSRKDNDPLGLSALPREVPNTSKSDSHSHSSNRVNESSNSSHSFSRTSDETVKQENNRSSCQQEDSANRRRKVGPISQRTPSPAAKRVRTNDYSLGAKTMVKEQSYEVIEIKEEPDDEPSVFFGNSGSGQDIQTPDFTNVVMESLDRVNQIEGSELGDGSGGDGMGGPQQPVFPVMFHQNEGMSGGPIPGPSSDPQSVASTSGDRPTQAEARQRQPFSPLYRDAPSARSYTGYRRYSRASLRLGVIRVLQGETVRKVSIQLRLPRETLRRHVEKAKRSFFGADSGESFFADELQQHAEGGVQHPADGAGFDQNAEVSPSSHHKGDASYSQGDTRRAPYNPSGSENVLQNTGSSSMARYPGRMHTTSHHLAGVGDGVGDVEGSQSTAHNRSAADWEDNDNMDSDGADVVYFADGDVETVP